MPRLARGEVISPDEIQVIHAVQRCVRRAFLCGDDPLTGKSFEYRRPKARFGEGALRALSLSLSLSHTHVAHSNPSGCTPASPATRIRPPARPVRRRRIAPPRATAATSPHTLVASLSPTPTPPTTHTHGRTHTAHRHSPARPPAHKHLPGGRTHGRTSRIWAARGSGMRKPHICPAVRPATRNHSQSRCRCL